jgi:hypothetical protein
MKTAWDLHQVWTNAELKVIQDAGTSSNCMISLCSLLGHSFSELAIVSELVKAADKFKDL